MQCVLLVSWFGWVGAGCPRQRYRPLCGDHRAEYPQRCSALMCAHCLAENSDGDLVSSLPVEVRSLLQQRLPNRLLRLGLPPQLQRPDPLLPKTRQGSAPLPHNEIQVRLCEWFRERLRNVRLMLEHPQMQCRHPQLRLRLQGRQSDLQLRRRQTLRLSLLQSWLNALLLRLASLY